MSAQLVVVAGPDKGKVFEFGTPGSRIFGRSQAAENRLGDPAVSRVHFQVDFDGSAVRVTDCGSNSGTLVNGQRVSQQPVRSGDVIQAGNTQMRVLLAAGEG